IEWEAENPGGPYTGMGRGKGGPDLKFGDGQRRAIKAENRKRNNGVLRDDRTGDRLVEKGDPWRPPDNQVDVDHICPRSPERYHGSNRYSNACVSSRGANLERNQNLDGKGMESWPPVRCFPGPGPWWNPAY